MTPYHKGGQAQQYSITKWKWHIWEWAQAGAEGMNKLHRSKPNAHGLPLLHYLCFRSFCTYGLMESSLPSVDREREESRIVYRWFYTIYRQYIWVENCGTTSLSGIFLKGSGEGKSCQSWQNFGKYMWLFTLLGRRNGMCEIIYQLTSCDQWLADGQARDLKETWLKN